MVRSVAAKALLGTALIMLGACSSIIEGTTQTISFQSNPTGAECTLVREGVTIGKVTTPGGLVIEKTKHNINVTCRKEGYQDSTAFLKSEVAGATWGNIILGGGIGWAIDSASGADNKYQEVTTVTMVPLQPSSAGESTAATNPAAAGTPSAPRPKDQRLRELDSLRGQNLITDEEYKTKRQGIIDSL